MESRITSQKSVANSKKNLIKQKPRLNNVDDASSEAAMIGTSSTVEEQVNQIYPMLGKPNIYDSNYDSDDDDFDGNCLAVISVSNSLRELEAVIMQILFGKVENKSTSGFWNRLKFFKQKFSEHRSNEQQRELLDKTIGIARSQTIPNDLIRIIGVINTAVKCNNWIAKDVNITFAEDGHRPILARDLFPQLGLSLTQSIHVLNIDQNQCPIKQRIVFLHPKLSNQIPRSKTSLELNLARQVTKRWKKDL